MCTLIHATSDESTSAFCGPIMSCALYTHTRVINYNPTQGPTPKVLHDPSLGHLVESWLMPHLVVAALDLQQGLVL